MDHYKNKVLVRMNMLVTSILPHNFGFLRTQSNVPASRDNERHTSFKVSAYWASTYLITLLTCRSSFSSCPSVKSRPGVSMTERRTLSKRDSQISMHAVSIDWVGFVEPCRKRSRAALWSIVAVGEMSAVSRSRRMSDVFPVPLLPTTFQRDIRKQMPDFLHAAHH